MSTATVLPFDAKRARSEDWFVRFGHRPDAALRIFCFPWSGAGASAFRGWAAALPTDVEVIGVQLPGRGHRRHQQAQDRLAPLARAAARALRTELTRSPGRFALFGHSLGALLAYEVARLLAAEQLQPEVAVLSGSRPPTTPPRTVLHRLTDADLLAKLALMDGLPADRLADADFLRHFLPLVRTDLTAAETYRPPARIALPCPVSAWAGSEDWYARPEDVGRWRRFAASEFRGRLFTGGHFFTGAQDRALAALDADLAWARQSTARQPAA